MAFTPELPWRPLRFAVAEDAGTGWFIALHEDGMPACFVGKYNGDVIATRTWDVTGQLVHTQDAALSPEGMPQRLVDVDLVGLVAEYSGGPGLSAPSCHHLKELAAVDNGWLYEPYGHVTAMFASPVAVGSPYKFVVKRDGKPVRLATWFPDGTQERLVLKDASGNLHGRCVVRGLGLEFHRGALSSCDAELDESEHRFWTEQLASSMR